MNGGTSVALWYGGVTTRMGSLPVHMCVCVGTYLWLLHLSSSGQMVCTCHVCSMNIMCTYLLIVTYAYVVTRMYTVKYVCTIITITRSVY